MKAVGGFYFRKVAIFLNENTGRKFTVRYDPDEMSMVALDFNGNFYAYASLSTMYNAHKNKWTIYTDIADITHNKHEKNQDICRERSTKFSKCLQDERR